MLFFRKLFHLPGPKELGRNAYDALPSRDFSPECTDYCWEDWEEEVKAKFPIKYFFAETVADFIRFKIWLPVYRPLDEAHYWLVSHVVPSRRYHMLDLRQPKNEYGIDQYRYGWRDVPEKMLYAMFNLLDQFVKHEMPDFYCPPEEDTVVSTIHSMLDGYVSGVSGTNIVTSVGTDFSAAGVLPGYSIRINHSALPITYIIVQVSGHSLTINDNLPVHLLHRRFYIYSNSENEIPGVRAVRPAYSISKDGYFNNILTISNDIQANDLILIRTLGLNHRRIRRRYIDNKIQRDTYFEILAIHKWWTYDRKIEQKTIDDLRNQWFKLRKTKSKQAEEFYKQMREKEDELEHKTDEMIARLMGIRRNLWT